MKQFENPSSGSAKLDAISKSTLVNSSGVTYKEFRSSLAPRYIRVWFDIALIWSILVATSIGLTSIESAKSGITSSIVLGVVGAFLVGYSLSSLTNIFHEAIHYNLAPSRKANEFIASVFISPLIGLEISTYRPIHFSHHRFLGHVDDEERTYFDSPNLWFLLEPLFGIKALRMLFPKNTGGASPQLKSGGKRSLPISAILFYGTILLYAALSGWWSLGLAWGAGLACVNPLFQSVRQLLEHRSESASASLDYHRTPHGACTRHFGSGLIASTFGSAGFNRHLLHHWDPQVSYTRLKDLEEFLIDTEARHALESTRFNYIPLFLKLFHLKKEIHDDRGSR